jgi:hypothetical protein
MNQTKTYSDGDRDAKGNLELRPHIRNQVIAISTVAGSGATNLQSASARLASGDVAIVEGYSNPGDGGGGTFYFQASPANRAVTGASASRVTILATQQYRNVNANDLRVLITTTTPHGLLAGQAVTISGCSDAGANGNFIVGIPPSGAPHNFNQTTQFFLLGSVSISDGTGGTISSTKVTITGHPYNPGQRVDIRAVHWTGGPGIKGVFDLIGRIDEKTISLAFFTAGSYVSGGRPVTMRCTCPLPTVRASGTGSCPTPRSTSSGSTHP